MIPKLSREEKPSARIATRALLIGFQSFRPDRIPVINRRTARGLPSIRGPTQSAATSAFEAGGPGDLSSILP
jgi:hypothetical protein